MIHISTPTPSIVYVVRYVDGGEEIARYATMDEALTDTEGADGYVYIDREETY